MTIEIHVPTLPESVTDATVLEWHKNPGDTVRRDENLLDLETDKVVLEVPAPADGILTSIAVEAGQVVQENALLGILNPEQVESTEQEPAPVAEEPVLTPAVRRLVKELNLDPAEIEGSGKDGRILKSDVMHYLDENPRAEQPSAGASPSELPPESSDRQQQSVPMTRLRATIAKRLVEAQQTAAILTTFNEVDLQAVNVLRAKYRDSFEKAHGVRLGFMSFFVKAVVEALQNFPVLNASVDGTNIIYHNYYDIGIAVGSPRGLVVPILNNADLLSFAEIEQAIKAFGKKAMEGTLSYEELTGGTFTISNGGVYGSMLSTPILNPPQSGILGMHNIIERPVVVDGEIVIRPMMYLALSYDHRIVDGKEAVQFLVNIKETLEDPARLLLRI